MPRMRNTILIAILTLATPVPANAFVWWDENGYFRVETADRGVLFQEEDMPEPMFCKITEWPPTGYITHYVCEDGFEITLEVFTEDVITVNGIVMTTKRPEY
jgi:hypothetical protein